MADREHAVAGPRGAGDSPSSFGHGQGVHAPAGQGDDELRMSFGDHLEELRRRIIYALLGLAVAIVACLFFAQKLVAILCQPLLVALRSAGLQPQLYQEQVPQTFMIYMQMSVWAGLIAASPWIIYQIWKFVAAGLYSSERRYVRRYGLLSMALFMAGAAFVYLIVMPFALKYFIEFSQGFTPADAGFKTPVQWLLDGGSGDGLPTTGPAVVAPDVPRLADPPGPPASPQDSTPLWIDPQTNELRGYDKQGNVRCWPSVGRQQSIVMPWFNLADYLQFIVSMMLVFGLAFQLPLVILFLAATGIAGTADMARRRRLVILAIVVVAAVISPTTDAISLLLLTLPMLGLFELGLVLGRGVERRRASRG